MSRMLNPRIGAGNGFAAGAGVTRPRTGRGSEASETGNRDGAPFETTTAKFIL
jgi:hypothetical protein